jgi:predicted  nucleic acid-binding Zn-ribbon protein
MNEETTEQELSNKDEILKAINDLGKSLNRRIDKLEESTNVQFEAIREGIVHNSVRFDRLESDIYKVRSDISALRADVKEMGEEVHQLRRENVITLEK